MLVVFRMFTQIKLILQYFVFKIYAVNTHAALTSSRARHCANWCVASLTRCQMLRKRLGLAAGAVLSQNIAKTLNNVKRLREK